MVETNGLENRYARKGIASSNLAPSANIKIRKDFLFVECYNICMKNIITSVVITLLVVAAVFFGWNYFKKGTSTDISAPPESAPVEQNQAAAGSQLSEQPNQAKFNEYFTSAKLGKLPQGQKFDPFKVIQTSIFLPTDQFCNLLEIKKTIVSGSLAIAVYNTETKVDVNPKAVFPVELKSGGSIGCEDLNQSVGKYEYKIYVDDVLAVVLPFEVK